MANLTNLNNKFLVTTGGKVGIGNTSPTLSTLTVGIGSTNSPSQICQLAGSGSGVYSVLSLTNTNLDPVVFVARSKSNIPRFSPSS